MIVVALYFTCQESLAFVGCNQFRWTTTVVSSSHRLIAKCAVDWGINISPWMAMAKRLWAAAHVAIRRLWTTRSTIAFSESMWVWANVWYFLHLPSLQVSTYLYYKCLHVYSSTRLLSAILEISCIHKKRFQCFATQVALIALQDHKKKLCGSYSEA